MRQVPWVVFLCSLLVACGGDDKDDGATGDSGDVSRDTSNDDSADGDSADTGGLDADADGFDAGVDCDDLDPTTFPGAAERCDGADNDCDGDRDEDAADAGVFYVDGDADGYGTDTVRACDAPAGTSTLAGDCDDTDAAFYPSAPEDDCTDPADYNCDGSTGFADVDGDGVAACEDCDDLDGSEFPGAPERCDGDDDDCDGEVDGASSVDAVLWYADVDGDGFGDAGAAVAACEAPVAHVADATDCNDADEDIRPDETGECLPDGSPPVLELLLPADEQVVNEGDAFAFEARVEDPEDAAVELRLVWSSDVAGILSEGSPDAAGGFVFSRDDLPVGRHVLTVTVTDTNGLQAESAVEFRVNGLPGSAVVTLTPSSPTTDAELVAELTAPAIDPDGDALSYRYRWLVDGVESSVSTSATLPASATARGDRWTVEVTATDGVGEGEAATASVVVGNTAPTVEAPVLDPDPVYEGDTLACVAPAPVDVDGDSVVVAYDWYVSGVALGVDAASLDSGSFDRDDEVFCTVTPRDDADNGTERASEPVVVANSAPSVDGVVVLPAVATAASSLACAYTGYADPDADPEGVRYAWTVNGVTVGDAPTLDGAFVGGDVVRCEVTPHDGTDAGLAVSASLMIENSAPLLGDIGISPSVAYNDDVVVCAASATDADGEVPALSYAWTDESGATLLGEGETLALAAVPVESLDTVVCVVTARDASGAIASGSVALTVDNRDPAVVATVTPTEPTRESTLVCSGAAVDPDGDATDLSFAWSVDGVAVDSTSESVGTSTLEGSFAAGQVVACAVLAGDSKGGWGRAGASVDIVNLAPVVTAVVLSPGVVYTDDVIVASVTATDADADPLTLTYDWYVDGTLVQSGTANEAEGAYFFDRGDTVNVRVSASDGADTTAALSGDIVVANTRPRAPVVGITPAAAFAGDDLACSILVPASDADGDPLAYTFDWDTDGVAYGDASSTAEESVVDGSDVLAGQTWTCEVVASDDAAASDPASASQYVDVRTCAVLSFDGVDDYATTGASGFSYGTRYSVEGWFQVEATRARSVEDAIFTHGGCCGGVAGANFGSLFYRNLTMSGTPVIVANDIPTTYFRTIATVPMSDGDWHHIALVSDGASQTVYLDGAVHTATSGMPNPGSVVSTLPFQLGGNQSDPARWSFGGQIGPWRVSSTARYSAPFVPAWGWSADADTHAVWNVSEGSGSSTVDAGTRGLDMTIHGAVWTRVECPAD